MDEDISVTCTGNISYKDFTVYLFTFVALFKFFLHFLPFLGQEPSDLPGGDSRGGGKGRGDGRGRGGPEGRGGRGGGGGGIGFGGGGRGFGGGRGNGGGIRFGGTGGGFRGRGRWCDNEKETFVLFYTCCSYTLSMPAILPTLISIFFSRLRLTGRRLWKPIV